MLIINNAKFSLLGVLLLWLLSFLSVNYAHPTTSSHIKVIEQTEEKSSSKSMVKTESHTETKNYRITDAEYEFRKKYGKLMLSYMNQSVDPCDDFYEYACGNWKSSSFLNIDDKIAKSVGDILKKPNNELKHDYAAELKLAQQFYQSCLNADLYPMTASDDYLRIIKSIGGFPAVDATWNVNTFNWVNMSAHLSNYGVDGLIYEEIMEDYPFGPIIQLPKLGFENIIDSDNIQMYETSFYELNEHHMRKYLSLYAVDKRKIKRVISEIFDFWDEVVERLQKVKGKCQKLMSPEPYFSQWINYFEIAWHGTEFNLDTNSYPCDFLFIELDKICEKHKEAVANYLAMKFLYKMDARLADLHQQKDYCQLIIKNSFPFIINKLYFSKYFNKETHSDVALIFTEIRKSLRISIAHADWLDDVTFRNVLIKASTIMALIGNNPQSERLIREMNNLTFVEGNFSQNNMILKKFQCFMKRFDGLHQHEIPISINFLLHSKEDAFYNGFDNSIYIMAGIFKPPDYHKYWPNSLKYGTIGYTIGHELTHGFDTIGSKLNSKGKLGNWWSKKSKYAYNKHVCCYIDHYDGYIIPEINRPIDGLLTRDENMADVAGLQEAFNAYRSYMKQLSVSHRKQNEKMPGLDLSPEQIFFLGFAQQFCTYKTFEHIESYDTHALPKYRILGTVTNNVDFSTVYNCPLGSKMNPKAKKCHLW